MVEKFVKMWYNTFACERQIGICEGGIYCEYRVLVMWSFGYSICDYMSVICNI